MLVLEGSHAEMVLMGRQRRPAAYDARDVELKALYADMDQVWESVGVLRELERGVDGRAVCEGARFRDWECTTRFVRPRSKQRLCPWQHAHLSSLLPDLCLDLCLSLCPDLCFAFCLYGGRDNGCYIVTLSPTSRD